MPDLPPVFRLVLGLYARRLGLTFEQFEAYATGLEPWPPGMLDAILETFEPLTTAVPNATKVRTDMQTELVQKTPLGRPLEIDHPFAQWLKARGVTVAEWARDHGYKRERVKSWMQKGPGARPIPRAAAEAIATEATPEGKKRSAVPATAAVWQNGIRE